MSALPVAVPHEGADAPPRNNGELVFAEPWEGRAFGLCVALLQERRLRWDDFRPHLVAAIAADAGRPYYESLVVALDEFVAALRT
ncbi:MAG TPA: hypothetical protein VM345_07920 [Acidimicrobiales bacterium]|nr:hypothetical protein [Acidimicrobiales bacterium]